LKIFSNDSSFVLLVPFVEEIIKKMNQWRNYRVVIYFILNVWLLGWQWLGFVQCVVSVSHQGDRKTILFVAVYIG
jgi:hypothetical protein